ncbi:Cupredoxins domain-containing protein [Dioscorea alata]|uniref:Cupredoxins domain-containing protein n=2 Tax=Dioscorea alata TaxID=55571 RepID=A0ACB7W3R6_DIOAL|nr:Cupredoxins domain-containing protein [Dioscorea alata]
MDFTWDFKLVSFSTMIFFLFISSSSHAYKFNVGGRQGWVLNPNETYNHWAERNRFQVNDTLVFKYKKGNDSVLVVNKKDYYSCNINNPIEKFFDGDTEFMFDHSGPFFFVSGVPGHCNDGQKLNVVVLAIRNKNTVMPPELSPGYDSPPEASPSALNSPSSSSSSLSVCCSFFFGLMGVGWLLG